MSKLAALYITMREIEKKRSDSKEKEIVLKQLNELEEEYIIENVLPIIKKTIDPVLKQVERDLVLVVDYHPNSPVKVSLSRKRNVQEYINAKLLEPDAPAKHRNGGKKRNVGEVGPRTGLKVTFPDGTIIQENYAKYTLVETIKKIGVMKVRGLELKLSGVLLVSNRVDDNYGNSQELVDGGWYITTHSSTKAKASILQKISKMLGLKLKIEVIK